MAARFFIFPRHSETLFEEETSELRATLLFRKTQNGGVFAILFLPAI